LLHTLNNIQREREQRIRTEKKMKMGNNNKNKIVAAVTARVHTKE